MSLVKRWAIYVSILALSVSLLAGCSGNSTNSERKVSESTATDTPVKNDQASTVQSNEVSYPSNIKYWVQSHPSVSATMESANEVTLYKELERITGTKVEFIGPAAEVQQQFNLMLASGNLPDVIEHNWLKGSTRGPENAIEEGVILRLNDLIEEHAPNFSEYLKDNPEIDKMIRTDEGSIYVFPFLRGHDKLKVFYGPVFREDWLKKLNLELPETISEWENVLRAFRDQDPNGNGIKDEIPLTIPVWQILQPGYASLIGTWGITGEFFHVNNKIKYGPIEPQFKDFVVTMNKWYEEGLIDKDFATMDGKLMDAKVTNNQLGSMFLFAGGGIGKYMSLMKDQNPDFSLTPASQPVINKGETPIIGQQDFIYPGHSSVAITTKAKNPEQIVKWLDFAYSEEGHMLYNFGKEGVSYQLENGYPKYTDLIMNNPDKLPVGNAMGQHFRSAYGGPFVQDVRYVEQYFELPQQKDALVKWSNAKNEIRIPPVTLTADEDREFASVMNDVNTYVNEMMVKFIMGAEPIDSFDKYVNTIKGFGIDEAIAIQQAALERYNKR